MKIGIQLWSVREELKIDFKGVLHELARIGFEGVEFARVYGEMEPGELGIFLKESGLECAGLYENAASIAEDGNPVYGYASALSCKYFSTGLAGKANPQEWPEAIELVKTAAGISDKNGIQFLYHNHHQEFAKIGNEYALDILFNKTDRRIVMAELDVGWIKKGGECPVKYIRKYAGRIPFLHLRDVSAEGQSVEVGKGTVDMKNVINEAEKAGVEWLIYEHDSILGASLKSAENSFNVIKKITG
ncbi:MAG: hypothetical protein A2017_03045 [Lentisphaerae bacterium GWF2_44_16]|nr:MAG: hypothetical protein A2017_03045 [Lentisphaerae bacterium GWF2_44_16]